MPYDHEKKKLKKAAAKARCAVDVVPVFVHVLS